MNILEKLNWLNDTVKDLDSDNPTSVEAAKIVLRHYSEDIARALLEIAYTGDDVVQEVQKKLIDRSKRGMKYYGISMADNISLSPQQWIDHAVEELLDGANYLTKLKGDLDEQNTQASNS